MRNSPQRHEGHKGRPAGLSRFGTDWCLLRVLCAFVVKTLFCSGRRDSPMPRRIALLKPSALGDIAHALPVLTALRERFPEARITWVVNKSYEPLLAGHPHLTDTLPFDRGAFNKGPAHAAAYSLRFADELRRRR